MGAAVETEHAGSPVCKCGRRMGFRIHSGLYRCPFSRGKGIDPNHPPIPIESVDADLQEVINRGAEDGTGTSDLP